MDFVPIRALTDMYFQQDGAPSHIARIVAN